MAVLNNKEQRMLDKVFNLDCYDQELWVVDNEEYIKNSSDEFKSEIKDLNFTTGQSALENLNADFYNQTMKENNMYIDKYFIEVKGEKYNDKKNKYDKDVGKVTIGSNEGLQHRQFIPLLEEIMEAHDGCTVEFNVIINQHEYQK
jgi:predicted RND superfamily exporter protein